ncbi:MAG: ferric iron reductase [Pseudobdellovibrionaceae bacterium]
MLNVKLATAALLCSSILSSSFSWAISKEMHAMVRMETHSNAVASRDSNFVKLEHYEIPLELVVSNIALRSNPEFVNSMIFEKNGKKFVRWVINPEDTKWYKEVEAFLIKHNIQPVHHKHFIGYMTASRSYIAVDPKTGAEFSVKVSTDKTGGNWRDKKQTLEDGEQIRMMTDFVNKQVKSQPELKNIILADEPIVFGIKDIDHGMVIRSYEELTKSGKRYVPGFSIMHEKFGKDLALANGSSDPAAYWNEHYNKPLARALAEFFALTGMAYDSPHSQNFLVELDEKNRPTGKIVLRDFGDTYLATDFFKAVHREDILKTWEQSNLQTGSIGISVGVLHGNTPPSWMNINSNTANSYDGWGQDFFIEFEKEFKQQTGIDIATANPQRERRSMGSFYITKRYSLTNDEGKTFLELSSKNMQRENHAIGTCQRALIAL